MADVKRLTAQEYAALEKYDPHTAYGLRFALVETINALDKKPTPPTRQDLIAAFNSAVEKEPLLKAAGTTQLVKNYYNDVITNSSDEALKNFYSQVKGKSNDQMVANVRDGKLDIPNLYPLGKIFQTAGEALNIKDFSTDFKKRIKDKPELVKDVTITPSAINDKQADTLLRLDLTFRKYAGKNQNVDIVSSVDYNQELLNSKILTDATQLANGAANNDAATALIKKISGSADSQEKYTVEDGKKIGLQILNGIVKNRCTLTKVDEPSLNKVVTTKGQEALPQYSSEEQDALKKKQEEEKRRINDMGDGPFQDMMNGPLGIILAFLMAIVGAAKTYAVTSRDKSTNPQFDEMLSNGSSERSPLSPTTVGAGTKTELTIPG